MGLKMLAIAKSTRQSRLVIALKQYFFLLWSRGSYSLPGPMAVKQVFRGEVAVIA